MSFFKVDILTPQSAVVRNVEADSILIPTTTGEIQVLPEHTHLVTKLDTGALILKTGDKKIEFSITTGTCRILNDRITILSNVCERAGDINLERAEKALSNSQSVLAGSSLKTNTDVEKYQRKLARARLRIALSKKFNA